MQPLARESLHLHHRPVGLDQPHEPPLLPVLALAVVAEDAQDGRRDLDGRRDVIGQPQVHVHRLGDPLGGHVAAQHDVEAHLAGDRVRARLQPDVVDVRVRVVVAAARDGDVELARQVAPHRVAALARLLVERDQVVECLAVWARVDGDRRVVDARERRADHVAHVVERRVEARLASRVQPVDDLGRVLELHAADLDVLPRCDVDDAELGPVGLDALGVEAQEVGVDDAVGDAHAHHELARRALVAVHEAHPLEARVEVRLLHVLPVHLARADGGGVLVDGVEDGRRVLSHLGLLDRVARRSPLHGGLREEGRARPALPRLALLALKRGRVDLAPGIGEWQLR